MLLPQCCRFAPYAVGPKRRAQHSWTRLLNHLISSDDRLLRLGSLCCNAAASRLTQSDQREGPNILGQDCSTHLISSDDRLLRLGSLCCNAAASRLTQSDQRVGPTFLDKTAQPIFWHLLATMKELRGTLGIANVITHNSQK